MHVDQLVNVIDYAIGLVGEDHIALGSDFDGGPPLPREIKDISDYPEMTKALKRKGYTDSRIKKILGLNWLRVHTAGDGTVIRCGSGVFQALLTRLAKPMRH